MLTIFTTKQISSEIVEISTVDGSAFFIRFSYLKSISPDRIIPGEVFSDFEETELLNAGLAFAAERKALELIERCEQYRAGLERKLLAKNFDKNAVSDCLDYLESKNYLNDRRFAFAWIRNHVISKPQGKLRLSSELLGRGVNHTAVKEALVEFFEDEENDEMELCRRACKKYSRTSKSPEKLFKTLFDQGFTYKMINEVLRENK